MLDLEQAVYRMIKDSDRDQPLTPVDRQTFNKIIDDWINVLETQGRAFTILEDYEEQGVHWYEISCIQSVAEWIEREYADQEDVLWYRVNSNRYRDFKIHAKIFTLLSLKWQR